MSFSPVIALDNVGKCYQIYDKPRDRLLQMFWRRRRRLYREFWALRDLNLQVRPGEVVGVIGANGAGKSTLLQLVCGTLAPSCGHLQVNGRVAALLELGAGFNPEFTGRENVFLSAAVMGMTHDEISARFEEIVAFSGIAPFIDQPVKTYSSGMYVRLAFAVAIHVDPDILVIDEALSVGDGEFARKSFDRIMSLKDAGKTILFCSHALYQVEALCNRAIWLDQGQVRQIGSAQTVIASYSRFLEGLSSAESIMVSPTTPGQTGATAAMVIDEKDAPLHRISTVMVQKNREDPGKRIDISSQKDMVTIHVAFFSRIPEPPVHVGIVLTDTNERIITSFSTFEDHVPTLVDSMGLRQVRVRIPACPLLKGQYLVYVFLLCDRAICVHDHAHAVAEIHVSQDNWLQGVVVIPHEWV
ncbi:ABC transporter ATP-binding protein [Trichloromonas sp.]|uniref:ABC transporter ATP-binding protein n=1 Tax=Trichloromonas sp. TaxID=3069249 RepID=UPI002A43882F|nr:ABC transporter ATP-binding protein [Desulfuromonadales bacterium]MDY0269048.1 ABC transporter ATP-binding protein [Trichloromonas sp.]